jgi:hypothetical protein
MPSKVQYLARREIAVGVFHEDRDEVPLLPGKGDLRAFEPQRPGVSVERHASNLEGHRNRDDGRFRFPKGSPHRSDEGAWYERLG